MPSPFPGMDPYLEDPAYWADFHHRFIDDLSDAIAAKLPGNYFTKIDELKPAAVAEIPSRIGKVDEFRLGIHVRPTGSYIALLQSETISRNCELCGNPDGNWEETLRRESDVLPVKIAVIDGMIEWAAGVQREM